MLEVTQLKKSFAGREVLKDISFNADKGEIVALLGPSGSGKTTLLNILLGLMEHDGGQIFFSGQDVTGLNMKERGFNIVFQDYALFPHLNAYENIVYGLRNRKDLYDPKKLEEYVHILGLHPHLDKKIHMLSGGQKQRVAIARTLVMQPHVLLLDEPLSALDSVMKESIKRHIRNVAKELKLTTIIVTHDPEEALTLSDKVLIINEGVVEQFGRPEHILHQPGSNFIQTFISDQLKVKYNNIHKLFGELYA